MATPDAQRIIKNVFDATNNALRVGPVGGSVDGTIALDTAAASSSSGTLTLNFTATQVFTVTTTENISTITVSNPVAGQKVTIIFTQGASHTIAFPAGWKWAGGTAPTFTTGAGAIDIVSVLYDGSRYFAEAIQDLQ